MSLQRAVCSYYSSVSSSERWWNQAKLLPSRSMQPYGMRLCLQSYSPSDSGLTVNSLNLSTHVLFGVKQFDEVAVELAVAHDACRRW
jgi:hypothetical protein